jgi:hypothetical protein
MDPTSSERGLEWSHEEHTDFLEAVLKKASLENTILQRKRKKATLLEQSSHSISLPNLNRLGKAASKDTDIPFRQSKKIKVPIAWPDQTQLGDQYSLFNTPSYSQSKQQKTRPVTEKQLNRLGLGIDLGSGLSSGLGLGLGSNPNPRQLIASELQKKQQLLTLQKQNYSRNENQDRLRIFKNATTMVQGLPLQYLYSKPELKHYALEQLFQRFQKFAILRYNSRILKYFHRWKNPREIKLDDRQIGFMVISKALETMLDRMIQRAFKHWAIFYSKRFDYMGKIVMNEAALQIQRWYRLLKQTRAENYKRLGSGLR